MNKKPSQIAVAFLWSLQGMILRLPDYELGYDPYGRAQLVIDEWHLLLMSYAFRGEAIRGVLNEAKQFRNVTYISATPVEEKFWFPEMKGFRKMEIE